MDLDDDELKATRNGIFGRKTEKTEENEKKEYKIYTINKDGKYYAKEIYVGGPDVIRIVPTISRSASASLNLERTEKYIKLLKESSKDPDVSFGYEEV